MENKTEWYRKLLRKLNNIKSGNLNLDEYIDEVKAKIEAEDQALSMSGVMPSVITTCMAGMDGECNHSLCPQEKDGEPENSGRFCPLPHWSDDDE